MSKYVAIDPLAVLLPSSLYARLVEKWYPHVPKVADVQDIVQNMSPENRAFTAAYAQRLIAYGNVLRDQRTGFGNRVIGATLENPDFMQLAKAFGIEGHRVNSPEALRPVLAGALAAKKPVLIEVTVPQGSEVSPWSFIHPK